MSAGRIINCTDSDSDFDKGGVDNRRSQQNQPIDFSRILCFVSFNNLPQKIGGCASNTRAWSLFCIFCYLAKVNHWAVDVHSPILFVPLNRVKISTSLLVHGTSERDTCSCTCLDFIPETTTCQGTRAGQENQYDGGLELKG